MQGTFGRVFLATSRAQPGRRLAVKVIKPGKEQEGVCATALREMMLLRAMSHPNLLALDSMHMDIKVRAGHLAGWLGAGWLP